MSPCHQKYALFIRRHNYEFRNYEWVIFAVGYSVYKLAFFEFGRFFVTTGIRP